MTRAAVVTFCAACLLGGCAGSRPPAPAARTARATQPRPAAKPAAEDVRIEHGDLAKLDARELAPLAKKPVSDGPFSGAVESVSAPVVRHVGATRQIDVPIGAGIDIECFVYPKPIDAGGQLLALMKSLPKRIEVKLVAPTDVVVVGEYAVLFVEAAYRAKTPRGLVVGGLKLGVYPHPTTPMLCFHDEVGYHRTFERIVTGFAGSLAVAGAEPQTSRYVDIDVDRLGGNVVGLTRFELVDGDGGTRVAQSISTEFLPRSPSELTVTDSVRTEVWAKDGRVEKASYVEAESGEISEQIVLTSTGARRYAYDGLHQGKKISGALETKRPTGFLTADRACAARKKLLAKGGELRIEDYEPGVDPTAPTETLYRRISGADRTISAELGNLRVVETLDAEGRTERTEMPMGPTKYTSDRVFVRGSL
jgi:hypothetical protein